MGLLHTAQRGGRVRGVQLGQGDRFSCYMRVPIGVSLLHTQTRRRLCYSFLSLYHSSTVSGCGCAYVNSTHLLRASTSSDCKGFECWSNIVCTCICPSCMAPPAVPLTGCPCCKVHCSLTSCYLYFTAPSLYVEFVPHGVSTLVLCRRDTMQWRCVGRVLVRALWSRDTLHAASIERLHVALAFLMLLAFQGFAELSWTALYVANISAIWAR